MEVHRAAPGSAVGRDMIEVGAEHGAAQLANATQRPFSSSDLVGKGPAGVLTMQRLAGNRATRASAICGATHITDAGVSIGEVVQRIAGDALEPRSETGQYMLSADTPEVLYGAVAAEPPEPRGLYVTGNEPVEGGVVPFDVATYRPNVTFFSKDEQTSFTALVGQSEQREQQGLSDAEGLGRFKKLWERHKAASQRKIDDRALISVWKGVIAQKKAGIDELMGQGAQMGLLGNNDCTLFARALHHLIRQTHGDENVEPPDGPEVGTFIQHKYPEKLNECGYHGVTVVARDGGTLITLEAHAGQHTLLHPVFHMRGGVAQFVEDNTPAGLSPEDQARWAASDVYVEHVKGPMQNQLFGSVDEMRQTYESDPERHSDLAIYMTQMGVTF